MRAKIILTLILGVLAGQPAFAANGEVWTWGANGSGQLGDGSTVGSNLPVPATPMPGPGIAVFAGSNHSLAETNTGALYAWGENARGQLGDGTTTGSGVPVAVAGIPIPISSAEGGTGHSLLVAGTGKVWSWGHNRYGQLGNGTFTLIGCECDATPAPVTALQPFTFTQVAAGDHHSLALRSDGTVWAWGRNHHGQLGNGTILDSPIPILVPGLTNVLQVVAGGDHSIIRKIDGTIWAWGRNDRGQLGDGTTTDAWSPVQANFPSGVPLLRVVAGNSHSAAFDFNGNVWTWGANTYGQLGDGTTTDATTPLLIATLGVQSIGDMTLGDEFTAILHQPGQVVSTFGRNQDGQLGDGSTVAFSAAWTQAGPMPGVGDIAAGGRHLVAVCYSSC